MLIVTFLGPDGSGKSTIISRVQELLSSRIKCKVTNYHFRVHIGKSKPTVFTPYSKRAHNPLISVVKIAYWFFIYSFWATAKRVLSIARLREIAMFDRFLYDIVADPKRYRIHPMVLNLPLDKFVWPKPDIVFLLETDVEVLQRRKKEVSVEESRQQLLNYRKTFTASKNVVWLNGNKDIDLLVAESTKVIQDLLVLE